MPSAYTAPVQDGKITEFKDFAILCARAFGACIDMRDDPLDKPIPEAFSPVTKHYDEALATATNKLAALRAMTDPAKNGTSNTTQRTARKKFARPRAATSGFARSVNRWPTSPPPRKEPEDG